jgi:hypothetical protein
LPAEITTAIAEHLPRQLVVDGELLCWSPQTRRLDFAALQRRLHPAARQVAELARTHPANFVAAVRVSHAGRVAFVVGSWNAAASLYVCRLSRSAAGSEPAL